MDPVVEERQHVGSARQPWRVFRDLPQVTGYPVAVLEFVYNKYLHERRVNEDDFLRALAFVHLDCTRRQVRSLIQCSFFVSSDSFRQAPDVLRCSKSTLHDVVIPTLRVLRRKMDELNYSDRLYVFVSHIFPIGVPF